MFLGYPPMSKGNIRLDVQTGKVDTSYHCLFHESIFPPNPIPNSPTVSSSSPPPFDIYLPTLFSTSTVSSTPTTTAGTLSVFVPIDSSYAIPATNISPYYHSILSYFASQ